MSFEVNSPEKLNDIFKGRLLRLKSYLFNRYKFDLHIGATLRSPRKQAEMWCRSRHWDGEVLRVKKILQMNDAGRLAELLNPQLCGLGPEVTSHLPGQSWHQWGEAADVGLRLSPAVIVWSGSSMLKLSEVAEDIGLYHSVAGRLARSRLWHLQLRSEDSPLFVRGYCDTWAQVEAMMLSMWGTDLDSYQLND